MWKYYIFVTLGPILACLPFKIGYLVARVVADSVYIMSPGLRRSIADNMRHVMGNDVDDSRLQHYVRGVLRNAARNYFDLIKAPRMKLQDIEKRIHINGWDNMQNAINKGKGVIIVSAHLGSFDMTAHILAAKSVEAIILVETQEPKALLDHVVSLRKSKGLEIVPIYLGVLRLILRALSKGKTIGLMCDRDLDGDGKETEFFGETTTLPYGAVRIAMRTGASIVPAFNIRRDGNQYDVFFEPALDLVDPGDGAVEKNMAMVISAMERYISMCPEQWVVLSPIWGNGYMKRSSVSAELTVASS